MRLKLSLVVCLVLSALAQAEETTVKSEVVTEVAAATNNEAVKAVTDIEAVTEAVIEDDNGSGDEIQQNNGETPTGTDEVTEFKKVSETNQADIEPASSTVELTTVPSKEEVKVCHTDLKGDSGLFSSENFPADYKPTTNCTWNITVPQGQKVKLTFHLLNTEHNDQCVFDWVKVLDTNGTLLKHICGYLSQDLAVTSTSNLITVQFFSDGVIENRGFLASWLSIPENSEPENTTSETHVQNYALSFPQSFAVAEDAPKEKVCLQLNNVKADGEVLISLLSSKSILSGEPSAEIKVPHISGDSKTHCHEISLPIDYLESYAVLRIKADFPSIGYKILSYKSVQALQTKPLALIQTDKFDYRPKQEIKFRILLLNSELKPKANQVIKQVWIEEPTESRVAQWKEVAVKKGLAQLSMPLSDEPQLGTWKIKAELENNEISEATFTVSESVLPKFEVTIEGPQTIIRNTTEETFKVCAKYTHGSNVKGKVNITFISTYQDQAYWRVPLQVISVPKDIVNLDQGCATFKLNNTEIGILSNKSSDISAEVSVAELTTGETQNATWKGVVNFLPFKLDFAASSTQHIIGGFPYAGSLKAVGHDGTPRENIKVKLCARLFTNLEEMRNYVIQNSHLFYGYEEEQLFELGEKLKGIKLDQVCTDYVTKADGSIDFSVPLDATTIAPNASSLNFHAVAVDYPANDTTSMQQPFSKLSVGLSRSNSSSAITIHDIDQSSLDCSDNTVQVFYSAKKGEVLDINYVVTSGAAIVLNGEETVTVGEEDLSKEYLGDSAVIKFESVAVPEDAEKKVLSKLVLKINRPFLDETRVSKKIKLLVYLRVSNGQTLSLTKEYEAQACNKTVSVSWSADHLTPASTVSLKLKGQPDAFCGYSVVDKSVDLLSNPNKITDLKLSELKEDLGEKRLFPDKTQNTPTSKCEDANLLSKSFEKLGLYILSDALAEKKECDTLTDVTHLGGLKSEIDDYPVAFASASFSGPEIAVRGPPQPQPIALEDSFADQSTTVRFASKNSFAPEGGSIEKPTLELRNYFPETWLFDLVDLSATGEASLDLYTPHTITTWIADAVCADLQTGLAVSNKAELLVTQDFFADILLPYSVKRGEVLPVNVSAFNSVDQKLPMKLTVKDAPEYKTDNAEKNFCLEAKDSQIETFYITAKELNEVNITVEAAINAAAVPGCGAPGAADGYKDTLQKSIQVKPEGFPVEKVKSEFLCRSAENAENEETIELEKLTLPQDLVEGSARAWVSVTGDILAPALSNLDKLVTLPTGCGEQNMITLVPNIYLMEYLKGTNKSEPKLEDQAKKYMKVGYNRQNENYRHTDGAYSIWGPGKDSNSVGSIWLTTFVVKAFSQAAKYIDIDTYSLQKSIDWILEKQSRKSGCFEPVGQLIHSSIAGPEQSLTASVLTALLEVESSGVDVIVDPAYVETALRCIVENPANTTDVYTKSLVTYALTLHNEIKEQMKKTGKAKKGFQRRLAETGINSLELSKTHLAELLNAANKTETGKIFWTTGEHSDSRDVEVTAYNTLSLIMQDNLPDALQAIKWMSTKRNSQGGFVSTQDTMVAMQALSKYSIQVSKEPNNLSLKAIFGAEEHAFKLDEDNELLVQREKLTTLAPGGDNAVKFTAKGKGCFMVQSVLRYNVQESPEKTSFTLTAEHKAEELKLCASYTGAKAATDMVVIEAELLSGFVPYENSLEALLNEVDDPTVKRYEINEKDNKVVLYFDNMTKKSACWKIELKHEFKIEELKPAIVKIYDYYNQADVFSTQYNIQKE